MKCFENVTRFEKFEIKKYKNIWKNIEQNENQKIWF